MLKNTTATDRDRSIISGHYVFSKPEMKDLKTEASEKLDRKGINLEQHLKQQIKLSILRYLSNFRMVKSS